MKLGFVSAILPDKTLEEVFQTAAAIGYDCVEIMCWPIGKADRRYAGVTHINVDHLTDEEVLRIHALSSNFGIEISALGYYPNPLTPNGDDGKKYVNHLKKVIDAASALGLSGINTFIGRHPKLSVEDNWPLFLDVWKPLVEYAEVQNIRIGIENCPMLFTNDEWPGGHNLATAPHIWRKMFSDLSSNFIGLNYDPSHMIWQHMDYLAPMRDFSKRLFHIHAKDVRIDRHLLDQHGIMATPNLWHTPKLPGMGDVNWGKFFSTLTSAGYDGPVCVEVEDRAFEGSEEKRIDALKQSYHFLRSFVV
ncbi:MAG: sugar phosphate isomerase/epimerase [Saprospiraceae bacterium]|nr:sugar phosphate isomerase/epimerase [Saprospiraceae bacterium]